MSTTFEDKQRRKCNQNENRTKKKKKGRRRKEEEKSRGGWKSTEEKVEKVDRREDYIGDSDALSYDEIYGYGDADNDGDGDGEESVISGGQGKIKLSVSQFEV